MGCGSSGIHYDLDPSNCLQASHFKSVQLPRTHKSLDVSALKAEKSEVSSCETQREVCGGPGPLVGPENTCGRDSIPGERWGRANQSPQWGHARGGGLHLARAQALLSGPPEPCRPPSLRNPVSVPPGSYLGHSLAPP